LKLFRFSGSKPITNYNSINAAATPVLRDLQGVHLTWIRIDAGGVLGNHQAVTNQLFIVVSGDGWIQVQGSSRVNVTAGQGAFWQAGEWHESGTDSGLMALVVESDALDLGHIAGMDFGL